MTHVLAIIQNDPYDSSDTVVRIELRSISTTEWKLPETTHMTYVVEIERNSIEVTVSLLSYGSFWIIAWVFSYGHPSRTTGTTETTIWQPGFIQESGNRKRGLYANQAYAGFFSTHGTIRRFNWLSRCCTLKRLGDAHAQGAVKQVSAGVAPCKHGQFRETFLNFRCEASII